MGGIFCGWDSSHIPSRWQQFLAPRKERWEKKKGIGFIHFEIAKWLPQGPHCSVSAPPLAPRQTQTRRVSPRQKQRARRVLTRALRLFGFPSVFHILDPVFSSTSSPNTHAPAPHPHPAPHPEVRACLPRSFSWIPRPGVIFRQELTASVRVHTSDSNGRSPLCLCCVADSQSPPEEGRGKRAIRSGPCRTRTGAPISTTSPPRRPVASSIPTERCDMVSGLSRLSGDTLLLLHFHDSVFCPSVSLSV